MGADRALPATDPSVRQPHGRLVRILRGILVLVLALAVVGALTEQALTWRDARRYPPPGELVNISDGRRLHVRVMGAEHAGPTVILDHGHGLTMSSWSWLQPRLAEHVTVVSYDRPGNGWSDPGDADPFAVAADLHTALDELDIPGPYVQVGYSLGGLYARAFAASHPAELAGLVLLDPSHEDQMTRLPPDVVAEMESSIRQLRIAVILDRVGLTRPILFLVSDASSLPEHDAKALFAHEVNRRHLRAAIAEAEQLHDVPQRFRAEATDLGNLPVRLVSVGWPDDPSSVVVAEVMNELHRELAASLSTDVEHVFFLEADHWSMVADTEHAERTVAEILTAVEQSAP